MASRRNVRYSSLPTDEDDDDVGGIYDPRYDYTPRSFDQIPWKSIALALFLLSLGSLLLFLGFFVLTGHMAGNKDQAYGLLFLGIITFLPVFNYMRGNVGPTFNSVSKVYQLLYAKSAILQFGL